MLCLAHLLTLMKFSLRVLLLHSFRCKVISWVTPTHTPIMSSSLSFSLYYMISPASLVLSSLVCVSLSLPSTHTSSPSLSVPVPSGYPEIKENPTLKAVEKDRNTVMVCMAEGNPDPSIIWLKDFIPVDLSDPRLLLLQTGVY